MAVVYMSDLQGGMSKYCGKLENTMGVMTVLFLFLCFGRHEQSVHFEPAWKDAGKNVGLQIWRIEKFEVKDWPKEDYGHFYEDDSYIILNTYKEDDGEHFLFDVHFWIGKSSTEDEYDTAAYKVVELDTILDDVPVQHREVQGHESDLFRSYFKEITYEKGGVETGFQHAKPKNCTPRLFYVLGKNFNTTGKEDEFMRQLNASGEDDNDGPLEMELFRLSDAGGKMNFSLEKKGTISMGDFDSEDVFIFYTKKEVFVWIGSGASPAERKNAIFYAHNYLKDTDHPLLSIRCFKRRNVFKAFISALTA